jgi:hypothetical protein
MAILLAWLKGGSDGQSGETEAVGEHNGRPGDADADSGDEAETANKMATLAESPAVEGKRRVHCFSVGVVGTLAV